MDKTETATPPGNPGAKSKRLALKITVQDKTRAIEFTDKELPDPIKPEAKKEGEREVKPIFDSKVQPPPPKLIGSTSTKQRTLPNKPPAPVAIAPGFRKGDDLRNRLNARSKVPKPFEMTIPSLPRLTPGVKYTVYVSHFNSLSDFYVRQFDEFGLWDEFEQKIKQVKLPEEPKPWKNGIFVIFEELTGKMHRVKINSSVKDETGYMVDYIDEGKYEFITGHKFFRVPHQLCNAPADCINVKLEDRLITSEFGIEFRNRFLKVKGDLFAMEMISDNPVKKVVKLYFEDVPVSDIISGNKPAPVRNSAISKNPKSIGAMNRPKAFQSPPRHDRKGATCFPSDVQRHRPPPPSKFDNRNTHKSPRENTQDVYGTRNGNPPKHNYYQSEPPPASNSQTRIGDKPEDVNERSGPKQLRRSPLRYFGDHTKSSPEESSMDRQSPRKSSHENRVNIREEHPTNGKPEAPNEAFKRMKLTQESFRSPNITTPTESAEMNKKEISQSAGGTEVAQKSSKADIFKPVEQNEMKTSVGQQKIEDVKKTNSVRVEPEKSIVKEVPKIASLKRKSIPKDSFVKVRATEIISPSEFYIFNEENAEVMKEIKSILSEKFLPPFLTQKDLMAGTRCIVLDGPDWHRAELLGAEDDTCALQLLDSGKLIAEHPSSELRQMPDSISKILPLAVNVKLAGLCPDPVDEEWNENVIEVFKTLLGEGEDTSEFFLTAKSLSESAESLEESLLVEVKDDQNMIIAHIMLDLLPGEVVANPVPVQKLFWETSPFKLQALPQDFKENLTFQSFTDVLDKVNLYRGTVLEAMENELYGLVETLTTESELENDQLCIVKVIVDSNDVQLYRARIKNVDDSMTSFSVDLFDYEMNLELVRGSSEGQYLCDGLEENYFEIKAFPAKLLDYGFLIVRIKLDGFPPDLKPFVLEDLKMVEDKFEALKKKLQYEKGYNEFRIVELMDPNTVPPVVRIRSKAEKDFNSFFFGQIRAILIDDASIRGDLPAEKKVRHEVGQSRVEEEEAVEHIEPSFDAEKVNDMLRPHYQFLEIGSEHLGLLVQFDEDTKQDLIFWVMIEENFPTHDKMNSDLLSKLTPLMNKRQFCALLDELPINAGSLYLAYTDIGNGQTLFWRVIALSIDSETVICHFLDLGKQREIDSQKTNFIPMPGSESWTELISKVPEKFRAGLTSLNYLAKLKPLAHPCRLPLKMRKECTAPTMDTIEKNGSKFRFCLYGAERTDDGELPVNIISNIKST